MEKIDCVCEFPMTGQKPGSCRVCTAKLEADIAGSRPQVLGLTRDTE